jgi:hypothetical protein
MRWFFAAGLLLLFILPAMEPAAALQTEPDAWTKDAAVMRLGPSVYLDPVTELAPDTGLRLAARSEDQAWVWGQTTDGTAQGWIASEDVRFRDDFQADQLPLAGVTHYLPLLESVPVMPDQVSDTVREIYEHGQELGNNSTVFSLVGDCNSDTRAFLFPLDFDEYDLGPYAELEPTVQYFSGSFSRDSIGGRFGYSALTVLDPWFADPNYCQRGESSVSCEYRASKPSVAIILFGANDVVGLTPQEYSDSMHQIVQETIDAGIIPVLHTFPWCLNDWTPDKALLLNVITVEIAREFDVPLVNFWLAARDLPNCGFATSTHHLSQAGPLGSAPFVSFNGEEAESGNTLRNLLTLQALDLIRREVLSDTGE